VQGIPSYRLPRRVLTREIDMIRRMGVDIKGGCRLGRDFTLEELRHSGYSAVFLAVGAPDGLSLRIPGEEHERVVDAMTFLREYNLRGSAPAAKAVAVIGGGNSAVDAARTAIRLGAERVTVLYRRTRAEMPAYAPEVEDAQREGVRFGFLLAPSEIVMAPDGGISGVRCSRMTLGDFDKSGRRRPVDSGAEQVLVEAALIIVATGQQLNAPQLQDGTEVQLTGRGFIEADPRTGVTSVQWLFAGGDAATGPGSVVQAVRDGERAAVGIDEYLTGEAHAFWCEDKDVDAFFDPDAEPVPYQRAKLRLLAADKRKRSFDEVELPWSEPVATREAKRCLRCDYMEECEPERKSNDA